MSSIKPTNSKFQSVAEAYNYLRESSPSEVVSTTTTSPAVDSTRVNNRLKAIKKQKKEKETANPMDNTQIIQKLPSGRVRYGPITVNPRKQPSKTLFTGRRSKYEVLEGEEEEKRRLRRDRNRIAATKCREKREQVLADLEVEVSNETNKYADLIKVIQKLTQQKYNIESFISNHFPNCPLQQQQDEYQIEPFTLNNSVNYSSQQQQQQEQTSMVFGDISYVSSIGEAPAPPLPPQPLQLIANNEEEFTAFLEPVPLLVNSAYGMDQSNSLFNSQSQQQQTLSMSSSLERIINNLSAPTGYIDNNNNCSGLFNSAYGISSCARQHSGSSEDESPSSTHKNSCIC